MIDPTNDQTRREFWMRQMDEGFDFMESIMRYPVEDAMRSLLR